MRKKIALTAILAIILALAVYAFVSQPSTHSSTPVEKTAPQTVQDTVIRQLSLSNAQRSQIKQIISTAEPKLNQYAEGLRVIKMQMDSASADDQYDEARITALANQQATLMAQVIVIRTKVQHDIYHVLTPQQKEKLKQIRSGMIQAGN